MKIALVSLDQIWEEKEQNLHVCEKHLTKASLSHADMIIFPEMTLTGFSMNIDQNGENETDSFTIQTFQALSLQYAISIAFGVVIKEGDRALNRLYVTDKRGEILTHYSKIHPFSFSGENRYFSSGNSLSTFELKNHTFGLTICYDLRFPELYSALATNSDIVINIANWPAKRIDHWNTLLKARAIENQIFIIGVNRTGKDGNDLDYVESSHVFNAHGESLEPIEEEENMKIFDIDKSWTHAFRNNFSTVQDRKTDLYKTIL